MEYTLLIHISMCFGLNCTWAEQEWAMYCTWKFIVYFCLGMSFWVTEIIFLKPYLNNGKLTNPVSKVLRSTSVKFLDTKLLLMQWNEHTLAYFPHEGFYSEGNAWSWQMEAVWNVSSCSGELAAMLDRVHGQHWALPRWCLSPGSKSVTFSLLSQGHLLQIFKSLVVVNALVF